MRSTLETGSTLFRSQTALGLPGDSYSVWGKPGTSSRRCGLCWVSARSFLSFNCFIFFKCLPPALVRDQNGVSPGCLLSLCPPACLAAGSELPCSIRELICSSAGHCRVHPAARAK